MEFDSIPSELQSKTDAELASLLPHLTSGPIRTERVMVWLRENDLAVRSAFGAKPFSGALPTIAEDPSTPAAIQAGLDLFFGHLLSGAAEIHTNTEKYALQTSQIFAALKALNAVTDAQIEDFYKLDGGRPWKDVTEAEITAARSAKATKEGFNSVLAHVNNEILATAEASGDKVTLATAYGAAKAYVEAN